MRNSRLSALFSPLSVTPAVIALPPIPHSSSAPRLPPFQTHHHVETICSPTCAEERDTSGLSPSVSFSSSFPEDYPSNISSSILYRSRLGLYSPRKKKRQEFIQVCFVFYVLFSVIVQFRSIVFFFLFLFSFARSQLYSLLFLVFPFGCFARISN